MFSEKVVDKSSSYGWIEVITGSMFSGKTEELIRRLNRAIIAKKKVKIFKPEVDSRYDKNKVVSHDSNEINSTVISSSLEIVKLSNLFFWLGLGSVWPYLHLSQFRSPILFTIIQLKMPFFWKLTSKMHKLGRF